MNQKTDNTQRRLVVGLFVLAMVLAICAVAYWKFGQRKGESPSDVAAAEVAADFFTSLAALDVEESELAARVLKRAVAAEPREPALWANLTVAHLRLRDMEGARESLDQAMTLAGDSRELALLRAEFLEQAGEIEPAIEQLRELAESWPENIVAKFSLVSLLAQVRSGEADTERMTLLSDILARVPGNLRARCEQARLAATLQRSAELRTALDALLRDRDIWPEAVRQQLTNADEAAQANDFRKAAQSLTFFQNLLKPRPEYQQSLAQLGQLGEFAAGTPLRSFLRLKLPAAEAAEADSALTFNLQQIPPPAGRPDLLLVIEQADERPARLLSLAADRLRIGESAALPFPGSSREAIPASVAVADLNFDFRQDLILVGADGCRLCLQQEDGSFADQAAPLDEFSRAWRSVWAVDVEADGDLDLLLSDHESPLRWIRNNGDMTFTAMTGFIAAANVRELRVCDFDGDGDGDLLTLDISGAIAVWRNERSGRYVAAEEPTKDPCGGMAVGDVDRDGRFDLLLSSASGEIRQATWNANGTWAETLLVNWSPKAAPSEMPVAAVFLAIADIDNNGGVDVIASTAYESAIWLRAANGEWTRLAETPELRVAAVSDVNDDGLLDLVGLSEEGGFTALNESKAGYGWHVVQPRANTAAGDKRINSFGVGGRIEIRAGNLVQAAAIESPRVHFGLGDRQLAEVARIVWPNGTVQAEFDLQTRDTVVANQRLKGSCPWVFAFDGQEFRFVKDFIWRSPLGLRINAQTTAGVVQTEDWIRIPGSQLAAVDGRYRLRITAELWETHFFDHVALLAVDYPAGARVFVDERFVPNELPAHRAIVATPPQPLPHMCDQRGRRLDERLAAIDGAYADGFELGGYQGVAEEHWVEFDLPAEADVGRNLLLVGNGWIYPTDSSLNVALAQGHAERPFGLVLEQRDVNGRWQMLRDNLGFPAGKNKDVVIALPANSISVSRHFRLRTNMEVYWDALGWSYELVNVKPPITRLPVRVAELRQRGFSKLLPTDRRRPDIPLYDVDATEPCWLDLEGFYTRFGDVDDLLKIVDDRYVIMNAGDELVLEFAASDVSSGCQRDFVLVGDGWVKDGDFNTAFSQWVCPLPAHDDVDYAGPLLPLADDPVYRRHADDWRQYHTRYVTPRRFQRGLWPPSPHQATGE